MKLLYLTLLPAILALFAAQARAADPFKPPAAPNCGLAAPPPGAGVDRHMGALLRIHPRNPDIGPDYTGCQTLWAQDGDDWAVVTVAHYEALNTVGKSTKAGSIKSTSMRARVDRRAPAP